MAKGSTLVIIVALAGNLAIALAKFVASWISGSTAMLTEAIHSLVDTGDQVLLLVGQKRGARPLMRGILSATAWRPISGPSSSL
jgi:divalent metal cation (Fe/Co/Zn/Cd) transporter